MRQEVRLEVRQPGGSIAQALGIAGGLACIVRLLRGEGSAEDPSAADWSLEDRLTDALTRAGLAGIAPRTLLARSAAGSAHVWPLPACSRKRPISCCSTSPPTTSTPAGAR